MNEFQDRFADLAILDVCRGIVVVHGRIEQDGRDRGFEVAAFAGTENGAIVRRVPACVEYIGDAFDISRAGRTGCEPLDQLARHEGGDIRMFEDRVEGDLDALVSACVRGNDRAEEPLFQRRVLAVKNHQAL